MTNENLPCAGCGTTIETPTLVPGEAWLCSTCAEAYPELMVMGWVPA